MYSCNSINFTKIYNINDDEYSFHFKIDQYSVNMPYPFRRYALEYAYSYVFIKGNRI